MYEPGQGEVCVEVCVCVCVCVCVSVGVLGVYEEFVSLYSCLMHS